MNCNVPTDIVFSFTGFAHRGGRTDTHHDGWGIAFFEGAGVRHFVDHQAAIDSPIAELIKRYPIKSTNVIAHIRKATQGQVALENCHPFVRELWGRYWVFAHNGDLKGIRAAARRRLPPGRQYRQRAGLLLPAAGTAPPFRRHARPALPALPAALSELVGAIAQYGTFNMLLSDGTALFAHCSTKLSYIVRQYPFVTARLSDEDLSVDFSQVTTPKDRVAIIVTEPLTTNETWTAFRAGGTAGIHRWRTASQSIFSLEASF